MKLLKPFPIVLLCAAVFLFFKAFFDLGLSPLSTEILSAVLGSTLTVGITLLLLDKQSETQATADEVRAAENARFERILELSRAFLRSYVRAAHDQRLTPAELLELEELALTISLFTKHDSKVGGQNAGELLCRFVLQLEVFGLQQEGLDERRFRDAFGPAEPIRAIPFVEVLEALRRTLGVLDDDAAPLDGSSFAARLLANPIDSGPLVAQRAA